MNKKNNKKEKVKKEMNKKEPKILLIIPAYNEEENILKVCRDLDNYKQYDYVVINDGSKDSTLKILKENNIKQHSKPYDLKVNLEAKNSKNGTLKLSIIFLRDKENKVTNKVYAAYVGIY